MTGTRGKSDRRKDRSKSVQPQQEAPAAAVDQAPVSSRRSLLVRLWIALGVVAAGEIAWIAASFLRPRRSAPVVADQTDLVIAGAVDEFEPGSVTAFPVGKFHLVRLDDGGFLALHRKCTHLGCTVPWVAEEQRFVCPCHASSFDIHGEVLNPPAPRPLDVFAVRIENGIVKVDARSPIERRRFDRSHVVTS
jgi:cytochrome b6-f complex iron-sulfur subunit